MSEGNPSRAHGKREADRRAHPQRSFRRGSMDPSLLIVTLVGSVSAALTTAAFVPQVIRVWRLKDAKEISFPTFVIFSVGLAGWVGYGTLVASVPIIAANALTLVLALVILVLKARFDRSARAAPG